MAGGRPMQAVADLVLLAGCHRMGPPAPSPEVTFDLSPTLIEYDSVPVEEARRAAVRAQLREAFDWCQQMVPLTACSGRVVVPLIRRFAVGQNRGNRETLSASSGQERGNVLFSAGWPMAHIYRLASLILHEAVHQLLYDRESAASPVRSRSLGYSPWKDNVRPGRMVWHAYWTFTCQAAFVAEAFAAPDARSDPDLPRFLAEMLARLGICRQALATFDIVSKAEEERIDAAAGRLASLVPRFAGSEDFGRILAEQRTGAEEQYRRWASDLVHQAA
jgi:hypothetical protein